MRGLRALVRDVPFFGNAPDGLRCLPACLRMACAALEGQDPGQSAAERLAGFLPGKLTWNFRAYAQCAARGLWVQAIESMDWTAFARDPMGLLTAQFGEADAAQIAARSDLWQAACDAAQLLKPCPRFQRLQRVPELEDLRSALAEGALVICGLDAHLLSDQAPGADHGVLCYEIKDENILLHDPGLPPRPSRTVPLTRFLRAWSYPCLEARWLMVLRSAQPSSWSAL